MKKYFPFRLFPYFLLAAIMIMAYSCKKNNDGTDPGTGYFMRFKVNGSQVEYIEQVRGTFDKVTSPQHNTVIEGLKDVLDSKNNMILLLATENETRTGLTYTSYTTGTSGMQKAGLLMLVYADENGKDYSSWPEEFASTLPAGTEMKATVKITDATTDYIKGNFSGVLYNEDYTTKLNITDGEFYAGRDN